MKRLQFFKRSKNLALLSLIAVFMALVRIVVECLWLTLWQTAPAPIAVLEPFLYAALITAVACFTLALMAHYQRYKFIVALSVLTIATLVVIKTIYKI